MFKTYFFIEGNETGGSSPLDPFRYHDKEAAVQIQRRLPDIRGYTQTSTFVEATDAPPDYVGVCEVWCERRNAALSSSVHATELEHMLQPDVRIGPIVTGLVRTVIRVPEYYEVDSVKGVFPFRRKPTMDVDAFQRYWWAMHGPIAAKTENALLYLQCHPLAESYEGARPPFDGVTELHWPNMQVARAAMSSRQMTQDQSNDAKNFVEPDSVGLFYAKEEIVLAA